MLTISTELNLEKGGKRGIETTSGIVYLVDKDMKVITAYKEYKVLWVANIAKEYSPPVIGKPEIRFIKLENKIMMVTFGKHCQSNVDIDTGKIMNVGCD